MMKAFPPTSSSAGITLIEALFAIAIFGMLAVYGTRYFLDMGVNSSQIGMAHELVELKHNIIMFTDCNASSFEADGKTFLAACNATPGSDASFIELYSLTPTGRKGIGGRPNLLVAKWGSTIPYDTFQDTKIFKYVQVRAQCNPCPSCALKHKMIVEVRPKASKKVSNPQWYDLFGSVGKPGVPLGCVVP